MERERWRRLELLFEAVRTLTPEERRTHLETACADDPDLAAEVEALVAASERTGGFIEDAIGGAAISMADAEATPATHPRIGPYQVERELGHGGMGAVYLAFRADEAYQKLVAIKLIRFGADDPEIRRRFLAERQILATLEHPHIARLLDGGTTTDGLPYVVMEYVDGQPVDTYCDRCRLSTAERLRLFRRICAAVQYAHRNLIVHRDVKPSNIMVTPDGTPKLLDFGIAKLLDASPRATRTVTRLMTPEYASPEQLLGDPAGTSSDIYSLGVVLYELLSGHHPYGRAARSPLHLERAVLLDEPDPPSGAVTRQEIDSTTEDGAAVTPATVGAARQATPERLRRILTGDLDTIVLMALRKEPERRYGSVEALSEDIRRYLEGLPVTARPDTLRYRAGKFLRRHRAAVTGVAAVVALIMALVSFYTYRLARERDQVRLEAARAEQVAAFLTQLFELADPNEARGQEITARELLHRGAERIDRELAEQPAVRGTMMGVIGGVYKNLGLYDEAVAQLERSLAIQREVGDELEIALAEYALAGTYREQGLFDAADSLLESALRRQRDRLAPDDPARINTLNTLALVTQERADLPRAEAIFREALAGAETFGAEDRAILASVLGNLGLLRRRRGDYDEAEQLIRRALAERRALWGNDHPSVALTLNTLGSVLESKGEYEEAERLAREAVALGRRLLDDGHPDLLVYLGNLAVVLKTVGRFAEAESIQREVVAMHRERLGDDHPLVALDLNNLANLRHDQGDYEEAERLHLEAMAINRRVHGDEHPSIADNLNNLSQLLADKGDNTRAAEYARRVLELDQKLLGADHEYVVNDLNNLGVILDDLGRTEEAEVRIRRALALADRVLPPDHPTRANVLYGYTRLLVRAGRPDEAEPLAREGLRIRREKLPEGFWGTALMQTVLGEALGLLGRYEEAERELLAGYRVLEEKRARGDRYLDEARERLARFYEAWGKPDRAAEFGRAVGQSVSRLVGWSVGP